MNNKLSNTFLEDFFLSFFAKGGEEGIISVAIQLWVHWVMANCRKRTSSVRNMHWYCLSKKQQQQINIMDLNPKRTGGGGSTPLDGFAAIISRNFFPAHCAFTTFFFWSLAQLFDTIFVKIGRTVSEVTQCYVIERRPQNMGIFWICV